MEMLDFVMAFLSSLWEVLLQLLTVLSTTISLVVGCLLLKNKLSLYLLRDEMQNKVREITKAQKKVRSSIPLAAEEIDLCFPDSAAHKSVTHAKLKKASEVFEEVFECAFEASSNVSTYSRLAELLLFNLAERKGYADARQQSHVFKVNLRSDYMHQISSRALSLIEIAAVKTTPLPRITKLDKLLFLPPGYKKYFPNSSAFRISGVEQGVIIRPDELFCVEFFLNVLGPVFPAGQHFVNRLYFSIVNGNDALIPFLVENNIKVPLVLNLSNIDRTDREARDPDVVDFLGDRRLHLIGVTEQINHGPKISGRSYKLTYSCLTYHNYFLNPYRAKSERLKLYFSKFIKGYPYKITISPSEMVLCVEVSIKDALFFKVSALTKLPFLKRYMKRALAVTGRY